MIQLDHITKTFTTESSTLHAVNDVTLHIREGEIFGIIGFSGAGKSTLVRCINLLERPTSGRVTVNGVELTSLPEPELRNARRHIGMIFQHFNLMPSRTVADNVALPLRRSGLTAEQKAKKVAELLNLVGLADKASAYPSELSGGQKQRVAIARALANDPKVLLCDEATSALDPQTTQSILKLLQTLNKTLKLTVVVITHQMSVVKEICHRVAIMENGIVKETASVLDIFARPQTPIARSFINTADNLDKLYEMLESDASPVRPGEPVLLLTFVGSSAGEPLINRLYREFGVAANIIYGNIDLIQGQTLGKLAVTLSGEPTAIAAAREFLNNLDIGVEEIQK